MLFLGNHFYQKGLRVFSHGLIGGGIAVLYLAVYAAYGIYQLPYMDPTLTMLSLSVVTGVAIWQSLRYDSIAVVILAMVGGFLTPVVLHGETANITSHISFYTYLVFLNFALLGVQMRKESWVVVAPLAQISTFALFSYWLAGNSPVTTLLPLPFIAVLWLLYHGYHCLRIKADRKNYEGFAILVLVLNAFAVLYSFYRLLEPNFHAWLAPMIFSVAFVYGITGYWVRQLRKDDAAEILRIDLLAIILLALASYYKFDGFTLAIVYAAEGLLLVWVGVQGNYRHVWIAAQGVYTLALLAILTSPDALSMLDKPYFPLINLRFLAYGSLIGALALSGVIFQKLEENLYTVMGATMKYAVSALGLILIAIEFNDTLLRFSGGGYNAIYSSAFVLMNIAIVIIYILPLVLFGLRYQLSGLSTFGLILLVLAVIAAAGYSFTNIDVLHFTPLLNMRAIPLMIIIGGLCLYAYFINKIIKEDTPARTAALEITRILAAGLGFILISLELYTSLNHFAMLDSITDHNVIDMLHFAINSCLPLLWTIYAIPLMSYALKQKSQPLFYFSLCVQLIAVVIMGIGTVSYAPISTFTPILNLRAIPFLLVLAGMAWENYLIGKNEDAFGGLSGLRETFRIFIAALIFEFITLEINDYFHRLYWVKDAAVNNVSAAGYRFTQRMILPMAWTLFALPVFFLGLRRKASWFTWLGLTALFIGLLWVAFVGFIYSPLNYYSPIFNVRFFAFLLVIAGIIVATRQLFKVREEHTWAAPLARLLQIVCALFLLELVSCEVLDYYSAALIKPGAANQHLKEMQQLVLSIGWLVFSILVLAYGFWRKIRNLRLLSMIVFTITIFKIFLFDLNFLDKQYRVLSIITLGLILFGASYLYQRYKDIIMAQHQE